MSNTYDTSGEPLGSTSVRVLYNNASNFDDALNAFVQSWVDRFGRNRKTWWGFEQDFNNFLINSGFEPVHLVYTDGVPLQVDRPTQLIDRAGNVYRIKMPATFPAMLTGNWATDEPQLVDVGDLSLRVELSGSGGSAMVGFNPGGTGALTRSVQVKLREFISFNDYNSTANFNTAKIGKVSWDSTGRLRAALFVAGDEELVSPATRDAFVTGRVINGLTDCHAFADRTEISGASDSGTYGTFDATTKWSGSNTQAHLYSFQDRSIVAGSGVLTAQSGFISLPVHVGSGHWAERKGVRIADVPISGGGTLGDNIGLAVDNLGAGTNQVGLQLLTGFGFTMYAPGGAPSHHKGYLGLGVINNQGVSLQWMGAAVGSQSGLLNSSATEVTVGAVGDVPIRVLLDGANRWQFSNSLHAHALLPMADNVQTVGDVTARLATVYLGSAPVVTSDARTKTDVRDFESSEIAAAKDMAAEIGIFKFLASIEQKGSAARDHIGMTVQRAIEILKSHGLDPFNYAFICHNRWDAREEVTKTTAVGTLYKKDKSATDEVFLQTSIEVEEPEGDYEAEGFQWQKSGDQTVVVQEARDAGDMYSFRSEQLEYFMLRGLHAIQQDQEARISALEAKLSV